MRIRGRFSEKKVAKDFFFSNLFLNFAKVTD